MSTPLWILWTLAAFFSGATPFAWVLGKIFLRLDIRDYGDGNPGATNLYRATDNNLRWYITALLMDMLKGILPVGIAYWLMGINDAQIIPIAIAPILGHAFSPFLGFKGGKALAVTGGVWTGLLLFEAPLVMCILLVYCFFSVDSSGWAVLFTALSMTLYFSLTGRDPVLWVIWGFNVIIVLYNHRHDYRTLPHIKRWLPFLPKNPPGEHAL
ncbi:MAG: glycerol-3-phosphate acyltransferase [Aggregatilineales bacterium]